MLTLYLKSRMPLVAPASCGAGKLRGPKRRVFMGRMPELILILAIFILLFGAQKLPEVGAALGRAIREFKKNMRETEEEIKKPIESEASPK